MFAHIRAIFVYSGFLITLMLMIFAMYIRPSKQKSIRRIWSKLQQHIVGYDIEIIGEENPEANMILLNHQSMLDIVVLESIHPADLAWVAKQEIEKIPLFGHILKIPNMIRVERSSKRALLKLLTDAKERIDAGRVVAIFPEGTRSKTDTLLPFKNGPKVLSQKYQLIVQPVVVINTRHILDTKHFKARSGTVKVVYLESIIPDKESDWYSDMHKIMQEAYTKHTQLT